MARKHQHRNRRAAVSDKRPVGRALRRPEACAVARSDTPQYAALRQAPASSGSDISSIAMSSGDMQRRRIMAARAFGQSDSTSVRSPISNPQVARQTALRSLRARRKDRHAFPHRRVSAPYHAAALFSRRPAGRGSGWKETDVRRISSRFLLPLAEYGYTRKRGRPDSKGRARRPETARRIQHGHRPPP